MMEQLSLFEQPSLNVMARLKAAMREALKACTLSREQVAERMTEIARSEGIRFAGNSRAVSRAILDKWVGEGAQHIIPIPLVTIFCAVTNSILPMQVLASALSVSVISKEDTALLAWARAGVDKRKKVKQARKLAEQIGI